ncbi:iron complex outermembrane recepter protein [Arenibacter nanhaiticus]|uniref:Iron complex outermembrane recepter protein n=1 Tax=Arenibacter nanhaiticus TaxID=558155 RepID=A0A1M6H0G4_9FLAO|nr:TonB-dependent receptor [Arenibacter nanhaiticus]SHJ15632.1 iron complex outermembrane recepter protein [Arenibacter nanhaiticus]
MKQIALLFTLFISTHLFSQSALKGVITDANNAPIAGAFISIQELQRGVMTNFDGAYTLQNIPSGTYTVSFRMLGYQPQNKTITFSDKAVTTYNTVLIEDYSSLDEVVVSASRNSEYLSEIPASITVVNEVQLQEFSKATSNINEILEFTVPGLAVSTGTYSNWGQTLRGRSLLVMVDGIPQSTPIRNGQLGIKSINPNDISRVEVIKGATSIFGNGGNGGFINYITKKPTSNKKIEGSTNIWGTSNLASTEDALGWGVYQSLKGKLNKFNYYISGSVEQTGNKYDAKGNVMLPTYGLDNSNIYSSLGKLSYSISDNQKISLNANLYKSVHDTPFIPVYADVEVFNEQGDHNIVPAYGVKGSVPGEKATGATLINGQLQYNLNNIFSGTTDFETDIYYQNTENIFFYSDKFENGGQSVINAEKWGIRPNFSTSINQFGDIDMSFTYGLDVLKDKTNQGLLDGRLWVPNVNLISWAPYLQSTVKFNKEWVLKAGLRYDDMNMEIADYQTLPYSAKGDGNYNTSVAVKGGDLKFSNVAYNLGLRYIAHQEFIPYVSFSQGFSIADLGAVLKSAVAENVNDIQLEPAVTENYEFGFISKFNSLRLEAVGYYSTSNLGTGVTFNEDLNAFLPSIQPQKIFGGEVAIDYTTWNNKLQLGTSYSYVEGMKESLDNKNELTYLGGDVISAPKLTAYVNWNATEKLSTSVRMTHLGDRKRFDPFLDNNQNWAYRHTEFPVNGYTLVNLSASYKVQSNMTASLAVNNLFNEYYLPARAQWAAPLKSFSGTGEGANLKLSLLYNF